jgi:soluble lytic murein transglycosylase-like protein
MATLKKIRRQFWWLWLLVIVSRLTQATPCVAGQAEPYLRVCKSGVIYYYFAIQPEKKIGVAPGVWQPPNTASARVRKLSIRELEPLIQQAALQHRLPPALIKAVIRVESNFNPAARSSKGAQGLMQLMPQTAEELQVADPYDIRANILGGTRYLGMLLRKFNFQLPLALAAYNAGPQRVEKCRDIPPIRETQAFVRDVCTNFLQYSCQDPKKR